jgi:hypothetical protein
MWTANTEADFEKRHILKLLFDYEIEDASTLFWRFVAIKLDYLAKTALTSDEERPLQLPELVLFPFLKPVSLWPTQVQTLVEKFRSKSTGGNGKCQSQLQRKKAIV